MQRGYSTGQTQKAWLLRCNLNKDLVSKAVAGGLYRGRGELGKGHEAEKDTPRGARMAAIP